MTKMVSRRTFLRNVATAGAGLGLSAILPSGLQAEDADKVGKKGRLPLWRGFNLLEKFNGQNDRFVERDFVWIAELGFNFVRLPMDYRMWIEGKDWTKFREETIKEIDEAIRFGEKYAVHLCLNFHRAPGYTVAQPPEAKSLWTDEEAMRVCSLHWETFAKRYRGIPSDRLSFNLFNEPPRIDPVAHRKVVARMVEAIRAQDADRRVICDGRDWGKTPPDELVGLGVATATRGYEPFKLTHYKASWAYKKGEWEEPAYPLRDGKTLWNRETLLKTNIEPWKKLEARDVGVMVGEFGAYNKTPHKVVLDWMSDNLSLWKEAGWGWALWNFRGAFGILDSGRSDVAYEEWRGCRLDRAMLKLLQQW